MKLFWEESQDLPHVDHVHVQGTNLHVGDRVRLWPRGNADIMDMALQGKTAVIEAIEQDFENHYHLAVVVDDDPGRDIGLAQIAHRFFFSLDEIEPIG